MHMDALKRVLRYFEGTIDYQIEYGNRNLQKGIIFKTDISWVQHCECKIVQWSSYLLKWGICALEEYGTGDRILYTSSIENELEAVMEGLKEISWMSDLLNEIAMSREYKQLKCDNLNAVKLANSENFKTKTKLVNRKCHFI